MARSSVSEVEGLPQQIRVSVGSAIAIGLLDGKLDAQPTTAYLMTYKEGKCTANCGFCPQAKGSQAKTELLSRVTWPAFNTKNVINHLQTATKAGTIRRVCVQTLNYPEVFTEVYGFVKALKTQVSVPVSVSCQPLNSQNLWKLSDAGADRVGIAVDTATESLFEKVKGADVGGPYKWQEEFTLLRTTIGIFGEGNVSTHLIVGLGETEQEAAYLLQMCVDTGILPAVFAFTPVKGTALSTKPKPEVETYRHIQLARYLIVNAFTRFNEMKFTPTGETAEFGVAKDTLAQVVESGKPFLTSGCPDCNRPFYNEKPSGPIYNYPRNLTPTETAQIKQQLQKYIE
ncbi:MAG: radical SAM protein [Candidatus Bathyarchaeota archaeon]|nr:radical SAM protein [Candidatus Bathyarchaeota archaeon]